MPFSPSSTLAELIEDRQAVALLQDRLPGIVNSPMLPALAGVPIADLLGEADEEFWDRLRSIVPGTGPDHAPVVGAADHPRVTPAAPPPSVAPRGGHDDTSATAATGPSGSAPGGVSPHPHRRDDPRGS